MTENQSTTPSSANAKKQGKVTDEMPEPSTLNESADQTQELSTSSDAPDIYKPQVVAPTYNLDVKNIENLSVGALMMVFTELSKDPATGIPNVAMGLMKFQRAKELGVPWGNAMAHMHIIKGKVGIDINIAEAIIQRPKSGIQVKVLEDYVPLYDYLDFKNEIIYKQDELPPNHQIINTINDPVEVGKIGLVLKPTVTMKAGKPIVQYLPSDYRTTVQFTRKKKDIDDTWITETVIGRFSWRDALVAKLPYSSGTENIDPNSNWVKRPAFMIYKSAYWDGAKKIANDLLQGAYDPDDLRNID